MRHVEIFWESEDWGVSPYLVIAWNQSGCDFQEEVRDGQDGMDAVTFAIKRAKEIAAQTGLEFIWSPGVFCELGEAPF